jgi:predicted ester cyclase
MDAISRGDIDAILEHFTPDCQFTDMHEGASRNRDELRTYLEEYYSVVPQMTVRIVSVVTEGDRLVGEVEIDGVYTGEGCAPGGSPITLHYCICDELENGLIKTERIYSDSAELAAQLPTD